MKSLIKVEQNLELFIYLSTFEKKKKNFNIYDVELD